MGMPCINVGTLVGDFVENKVQTYSLIDTYKSGNLRSNVVTINQDKVHSVKSRHLRFKFNVINTSLECIDKLLRTVAYLYQNTS